MFFSRNAESAFAKNAVRSDVPRVGFAVIVASLGINLMALALPLVLLQIFNRVVPNQSYATLDVLFAGLIIALLIDFAFKIARIVILCSIGETYELRMTRRVIAHLIGAEPGTFEQGRAGSHVDRQDAIATLRDYYGGQARLLHIDLPFTMIFALMIFLIGGWLILVPLACFSTLAVFRAILKRVQAPILRARWTLNERRYSFLIEFISQIATVRSYGMEPQMARRYEVLQDRSVAASRNLTLVTQFSQAFCAVFSQAAVTAMGLTGSYLAIAGNIGVAELAACMLLNGRTIQPMLKMLGVWVQVETVEESCRQLTNLFDIPQLKTSSEMTDLRGRIEFRDLVVSRGGSMLVDRLDIVVEPGSFLGLAGADGSGKSTLLQVLLGEYRPDAGRALIDGMSTTDLAGTRGRQGIVYLDRNPVVFDATILENLSLFGNAEDVSRAIAIARALGLEDDIHRLPSGYETQIRSNGGLTLGWLQRICLARALALEPKLLLLNNPNTALDEKSDMAMLNALSRLRGQTTVVLSSHRPAWLGLCDQVINLSEHRDVVAEWDADAAADTGASLLLPVRRRIA